MLATDAQFRGFREGFEGPDEHGAFGAGQTLQRRRILLDDLTPNFIVDAPASLLGRYMASIGLSWSVGLALAPMLGTQALSLSPSATFLAAAAVATAAAVSALTLERTLPEASRLRPNPRSPAARAPAEPR